MFAPAANETVKEKIKTDLGVDAGDHDFLGFKGLEQSVRDDVKLVKDSPMIDHALPVYGYIYDVRIPSETCPLHMRQPASSCSQQVFRVFWRTRVPSSLAAVCSGPHAGDAMDSVPNLTARRLARLDPDRACHLLPVKFQMSTGIGRMRQSMRYLSVPTLPTLPNAIAAGRHRQDQLCRD